MNGNKKNTKQSEESQKIHNLLRFSSARIKRILDSQFVNGLTDSRSRELRNRISKYEEAEKYVKEGKEPKLDDKGKLVLGDDKKPVIVDLTEARKKELENYLKSELHSYSKDKASMTALAGAKIRFSNTVPFLLATLFEQITEELLKFSMENCIEAEKKTLKIDYIHHTGVENLNCYPLLKDLPSWKNPPADPTFARRREPKVENAEKEQKEDANKKKDKAANKKKSKVPKDKPKEEPEIKNDTTSLSHYVSILFKDLTHPPVLDDQGNYVMETTQTKKGKTKTEIMRKEDEKFSKIKGSKHVKNYINDLLFEFMGRFVPLVREQIETLRVKTINDKIVVDMLKLMLICGCRYTEDLSFKNKEIKGRDGNKKTILVAKCTLKFDSKQWDTIREVIERKMSEYRKLKDEIKKNREAKLKEAKNNAPKGEKTATKTAPVKVIKATA